MASHWSRRVRRNPTRCRRAGSFVPALDVGLILVVARVADGASPARPSCRVFFSFVPYCAFTHRHSRTDENVPLESGGSGNGNGTAGKVRETWRPGEWWLDDEAQLLWAGEADLACHDDPGYVHGGHGRAQCCGRTRVRIVAHAGGRHSDAAILMIGKCALYSRAFSQSSHCHPATISVNRT